MLAQTSASGATAQTDVKSAVPAAAKPAGEDETNSDPAQLDPVALALAMVAQSMAASSQPHGTLPAAKTPGSAGSSDGSGAAANAVGATGSVAGTTDSSAASASSGLSMQNLVSLLTQADSDSEPAPRSDGAPSDTVSAASASAPSVDGSPTGASSVNPHLSAGSHFALQHASNDARTVDVKSPVGTAAWADELGGKITWMAHQGIDSASLHLSPEHLGPVEVRISVQDGATSVMFGAAHADTRSAIEQALPRLRQMFATQGLTLADAGVSREPPKQQSKPPQVAAISAVSGVSDDALSASSALRVRLGLLDTYA